MLTEVYSSLSGFVTPVLQKTHLVPEEWHGYKWDAYLHITDTLHSVPEEKLYFEMV